MVEIATCFFCGRRSANENRFCCIVPTEVEKRAVVRIGRAAKSGDRTIVSREGAIDDCLIKILTFSTDASVFRQRRTTSDGLYTNSRSKRDA